MNYSLADIERMIPYEVDIRIGIFEDEMQREKEAHDREMNEWKSKMKTK